LWAAGSRGAVAAWQPGRTCCGVIGSNVHPGVHSTPGSWGLTIPGGPGLTYFEPNQAQPRRAPATLGVLAQRLSASLASGWPLWVVQRPTRQLQLDRPQARFSFRFATTTASFLPSSSFLHSLTRIVSTAPHKNRTLIAPRDSRRARTTNRDRDNSSDPTPSRVTDSLRTPRDDALCLSEWATEQLKHPAPSSESIYLRSGLRFSLLLSTCRRK
jgi:hypothetical protein